MYYSNALILVRLYGLTDNKNCWDFHWLSRDMRDHLGNYAS